MQKQSRYYISFFKLDSKAARFKKGVSSLLISASLVNDLYGFISWQRMRKSQEG